MRFKNKTVIITGSGAGIGKATAIAFAREGANVVVNSVSESAADVRDMILDVQSNNGSKAGVIFVRGDISDSDTVRDIVKKSVSEFGTVDVLVNCAGIVLGGTPLDTKEEDWDKMMKVNVKGCFLMIREVLPIMLESQSGAIVNVSSVAAQKGLKNRFGYSASKGAMLSMTRAVAAEYVDKGIRCNAICPGTILTPSLQYRIDTAPDPAAQAMDFMKRQPIGRLGAPEEIAQGILFAADDATSFMTGSVISMNGGMII